MLSTTTIIALSLLLTACKNKHLPPPTDSTAAENNAAAEPDLGQAAPTMPVPTLIAPNAVVLSQLPPDSPVSSCHIDDLSAGGASAKPETPLLIRDAHALSVAGWAATPDESAVPTKVFLRLLADGSDGKVWEYETQSGKDRSDVAAFKGKPALAASGFAFSADVSTLPAGVYHAYLAYSHQGMNYSCNGGDRIVIE
jgi:hypothetical protein